MEVQTSWQAIKDFIEDCDSNNRQYSLRYFDSNGNYYIWVVDGNFSAATIISQEDPEAEDLVDFEENYKDLANTNLNQLDTDGAAIVRIKAAKRGWSFWAVPVEITTSTLLGTMYAKFHDDTDISWINCKIYDEDDDEITTAGVLNANLLTCVKTVVDFEPTFDYEIIGGALRLNSNPSSDIRMWVVGAPDIPAQYGGTKEFASGVNLKFLSADEDLEIDGRVTKFLTYNSQDHRGKMRIIFKHPAGTQINLQLIIHLYRL